MNVSVFGLGYVGCVSAGCLAELGHEVIGVEPNADKTRRINAGESPIIEKDIGEIIAKAVRRGRLRATQSPADAIAKSDLSLVCVGTPSTPAGRQDLSALRRVAVDIGEALRVRPAGARPHTVILRSTVLPGTTEGVMLPAIEAAAGAKAGANADGAFRIGYNPEFLREGSAVEDFFHPSKTVIGASDDAAHEALHAIYAGLPGPHIKTSINVSEMVKFVDNSYHALKVAFGNEIGRLCRAQGIDSRDVMDIFIQDLKLNISPAYLRPGFAFGGSCLPKDLRAITTFGKDRDLNLALLSSIIPSNAEMITAAVDLIRGLGKRQIAVLGLSFKAGTDDLRESAMVEVVERLVGKGFRVGIHDRNVNTAHLLGANKAYIEDRLPHFEQLLCADVEALVRRSEVVVVGNSDPAYRDVPAMLTQNQELVDLARLFPHDPREVKSYRALV